MLCSEWDDNALLLHAVFLSRTRDLQRLVGKMRLSSPHILKTGLAVGVPPCGGIYSDPGAKPSGLAADTKDGECPPVLSDSCRGAPQGDVKRSALPQARRLQRLISLLRSRAAFYT